MSRTRAPKINAAALKAHTADQMTQLASRFTQLEDQRREENLTTPHIALEALGALVGGREAGHSDNDLRKAWPTEWGM